MTKTKVPEKPTGSPMFTSQELKLINLIHENIFKDPFPSRESEWVDFVLKTVKSGKSVYEFGRRIYDERKQFLERFSQIGNKRLIEIRNLTQKQSIRKADIKPNDLIPAISKRKSPVEGFVHEILQFQTASLRKLLEPADPEESWILIVANEKYQEKLIRLILRNLSEDDAYKESVTEFSKRIQLRRDNLPASSYSESVKKNVAGPEGKELSLSPEILKKTDLILSYAEKNDRAEIRPILIEYFNSFDPVDTSHLLIKKLEIMGKIKTAESFRTETVRGLLKKF